MGNKRIAVIGAGVAGLVSALELAARGLDVVVIEQARTPGGKLREVKIGEVGIDAGPTVFTMRWVFDELFESLGRDFSTELSLQPVEILARHAWSATERLDLFADVDRSVEAIGEFSGAEEARRFREFTEHALRIYQTLENPFIRSSRPNPFTLAQRAGIRKLGDLWHIKPFATLWSALGEHFHDPRLRQLFGRYATYCGSSPFQAPATLMLVAHVEQQGVWLVKGGMHQLAVTLARLAAERGARFRYATTAREIKLDRRGVKAVELGTGEHITVDAVVVNADAAAVANGLFGAKARRAVRPIPPAARSLSAVTWNLLARTHGFPLLRHNVFFSSDYPAEFAAIFQRQRLPEQPTVYVCAQDRSDRDEDATTTPERLLCLVNAPANGDQRPFTSAELSTCEQHAFALLSRCGLEVERRPEYSKITTPEQFERLFPATGGALYGQSSHGWKASFSRPGTRTRIPGLYLAGGSVHPGPGVPMAALSGRLAAGQLLSDWSIV